MVRLVEAPLDIEYEVFDGDEEIQREFSALNESDEDPVGQWLKLAKARGETSESDQVLLSLIVELHRKVDELSAYVKNEQKQYIVLSQSAQIQSIGFEHFKLKDVSLAPKTRYYGRILMPVFPQRFMPVFFEREEENLAKIVRIHERDIKDWSAYLTARERVMIRELKGNNES